jgi:hypothetical protein
MYSLGGKIAPEEKPSGVINKVEPSAKTTRTSEISFVSQSSMRGRTPVVEN